MLKPLSLPCPLNRLDALALWGFSSAVFLVVAGGWGVISLAFGVL